MKKLSSSDYSQAHLDVKKNIAKYKILKKNKKNFYTRDSQEKRL